MKFAVLSVFFVLAASCGSSLGTGATVSGKTVYHGMGIEDVAIQILRWENGSWTLRGSAKSGYHGSFAVRVAAGRYLLEAGTVLPGAAREKGTIRGAAEVTVERARVDHVVIELREGR